MYLALAIGSLAAVSILGQVGKLLGPSFASASAYVTITVFLVSGLALLLFRHAVIPLKPRTLRVVVGIVVATGLLEIGVQAIFGRSAPKWLQLVAAAAFILVWSGCVGEPSVRLWVAARRRTVVQRARMRALSRGYLAIVRLLPAAVFRGRTVIPLGGIPPRSVMIARLHVKDAAIVLLGGPFTPVFGTDEEAWLQQYAAMVSTGLERVRLVEALAETNGQLEGKVREVTERTQQLEAANRELEAFSYTISHDLRAPLRAVSGFTAILFEEYADAMPAEALGYLKRVKDSGEHMGHLVDDLLAFSRLGRQPMRTQRVRIRGIVDRSLEQLAPALQGRQVEVEIGELPDAECDAALLEQVFVNLLSNAVKYSRKNEHARIEVGVLEGNAIEGPTYFVRDNGAGFDMEYAGKLFGVFQRMHRNEDFEGTGVGLAIVHRIVERHGGRIWAKAKGNEGATFYFTLKGAQPWRTSIAA